MIRARRLRTTRRRSGAIPTKEGLRQLGGGARSEQVVGRADEPVDRAAAGDRVEAAAGVLAEGVEVCDVEALGAVGWRTAGAGTKERISPTQRSP